MCNRKELSFSVYIIYHLANAWRTYPSVLYKTLNDTHIMDEYILDFYYTLNTQGEKALVEDITDFVGEKGL